MSTATLQAARSTCALSTRRQFASASTFMRRDCKPSSVLISSTAITSGAMFVPEQWACLDHADRRHNGIGDAATE